MANKPIELLFSEARDRLQEGDVLLFRGKGIFSNLIKRAGEGVYTHVGVASKFRSYQENFLWECVEFREWKGGRTINLERYVQQNPGLIDVYRPVSSRKIVYIRSGRVEEREIKFCGYTVTNTMRQMTGLPYGWRRIRWIAQRKLPVLRMLYDIEDTINDTGLEPIYPVCSTAVAYSFSQAEYDLTHHRSDEYMEPSDIARSALLHYVFTLQHG